METIFDHNPTAKELGEIGIDSLTMRLRHGVELSDPISKSNYNVSKEDSLFDLSLLMEVRGEKKKADAYWAKIQDRYREYLLGFDDVPIPE